MDSLWDVFLTMLYAFIWVMAFFLIFKIVSDVFRDHSMSGWAKAGWTALVILLPFVGSLIYLVVRGSGMQRRDMEQAARQQDALRSYVKGVASEDTKVDQLEKLARMRDQGNLTQSEFELAKGQLLG